MAVSDDRESQRERLKAAERGDREVLGVEKILPRIPVSLKGVGTSRGEL